MESKYIGRVRSMKCKDELKKTMMRKGKEKD